MIIKSQEKIILEKKAEIIVKLILVMTEIFYLLRVYLRFTGASPSNSGFTTFIYTLSGPFPLPFIGIVSSKINDSSVIEWSTIIGMIVYAFSAWAIITLLELMKQPKQHQIKHLIKLVA